MSRRFRVRPGTCSASGVLLVLVFLAYQLAGCSQEIIRHGCGNGRCEEGESCLVCEDCACNEGRVCVAASGTCHWCMPSKPHASRICREESGICLVYWVDDCGQQGEVAETCDCGCDAQGLACSSNCDTPGKCVGFSIHCSELDAAHCDGQLGCLATDQGCQGVRGDCLLASSEACASLFQCDLCQASDLGVHPFCQFVDECVPNPDTNNQTCGDMVPPHCEDVGGSCHQEIACNGSPTMCWDFQSKKSCEHQLGCQWE